MSIEYVILITLVFTVILLSGFLSFSEAALLSLNKNKFQIYRKKNPNLFTTKNLSKVLLNKEKYISTIIILNTIVNIGGSIFIGELTAFLFLDNMGFSFFGYLINYNIIFAIIFTFLILYFAEMIPKLIASQQPLKIALIVSPILIFFNFIVKPLVFLSSKICKPFIINNTASVSLLEVKLIIKEANNLNLIQDRELNIINNTLLLSEKKAGDLVKMKARIEKINADLNIFESLNIILSFNHKRIIVTEGENNEIPIGVILVKDVLKSIIENQRNKTFRDFITPVIIINEDVYLSHILADFNNSIERLAIIKNNNGEYLGVISIEDIFDGLTQGFNLK